ncbi:MAG: VIT domain-containing protein [bacterium]|nr:VIT domain-containing protein [bacterium]
MKKIFLLPITYCLLLTLSWADGIIIPRPPKPDIPQQPALAVDYHYVNVQIKEQLASTSIDQAFINPYPYDIEGTYLFPLPEESAISEFSLFFEEKKLIGQILDKDEARKIYEDIVRRMKDPGLLEYIGRNLFKCRVYPIPALRKKQIGLKYEEVLKKEGKVVKYRYPLDIEKYTGKAIRDIEIKVKIESKSPIKSVYSPSHKIEVKREAEDRVAVIYKEENSLPDQDFVLYYTLAEEEVSISVLCHKKDEKGFFLLLASPKQERTTFQKDITFILDTSGSMRGKKIAQAKEALKYCLDSLNPQDMFNIIRFSTDVETFSKDLVKVSDKTKKEAEGFIKNLQAEGGTNIQEALLTGIRKEKSKKPHIIIFLTDGLPTAGERNISAIIKNVSEKNKDNRIFVFGLGDNVNTHLLDLISQKNKGASVYVREDEDLEAVLSSFYDKIAYPALSSILLSIEGVETNNLYPKELPDLFFDSQLLVFGRYKGTGIATITMSGLASEKKKEFVEELVFPEKADAHPFIPRLWATRKIGYLLDQIRLYGESEELISEIKALSKEYGIITPYTSFLVTEEEERAKFRELKEAEVGKKAVHMAKEMMALKEKTTAPKTVAGVKYIEGRTYILKNSIWQDIDYKNEETEKIKWLSDEYFKLTKEKGLGKILSLGKYIIFKHNEKWYQVVE